MNQLEPDNQRENSAMNPHEALQNALRLVLSPAQHTYLRTVATKLQISEGAALVTLLQTALTLSAILRLDEQRGDPLTAKTDIQDAVAPMASTSRVVNWRIWLLALAFATGVVIAVLYLLMRHAK